MATIRFDVPDEAMRLVAETEEAFACAVRLAAAMHWYGRGEVSLSTAAALAGMNLREFMHALKAAGQDTTVIDWDDFDRELVRAGVIAEPLHDDAG